MSAPSDTLPGPDQKLFDAFHVGHVNLTDVAALLGLSLTDAYRWLDRAYRDDPTFHTLTRDVCPHCGTTLGFVRAWEHPALRTAEERRLIWLQQPAFLKTVSPGTPRELAQERLDAPRPGTLHPPGPTSRAPGMLVGQIALVTEATGTGTLLDPLAADGGTTGPAPLP